MHRAVWPLIASAFVFLSVSVADPTLDRGGAQEPVNTEPTVEKLGKGRFRIGNIQIDRGKKRFEVPGVILRDEAPLEFLVVTKDGFKAYESLLEIDANAYEFNTACLLVGLDPKKGEAPDFHFDPDPVKGDPVSVWVSWEHDGKVERVDAADLVRMKEATLPRTNWVYTGSVVTSEGEYLAHLDGTVIGFVHDPSSIIEHGSGFGLGDFGAVEPNTELAPPVGTPVTLTVQREKK